MTPQQIKDNAPCGATRYAVYDNDVTYYKVEGEYIYLWDMYCWEFFDYRIDIGEYDLKPLPK